MNGFRAVIFDLGGVVLGSPLHAIAAYERELGIPAGFVNRVVVDTGPAGAWSRLERGELDMARVRARLRGRVRSARGTRSRPRAMMERIALARGRGRAMLAAIRAHPRARACAVAALTNNWAREDGDGETDALRDQFDVFVESSVRRACASPTRASTARLRRARDRARARPSSSTTSAATSRPPASSA